MAVAWLLTLVAVAGIWLGAHFFRAERFSEQLAAAGGGLLLGICLFWLLPEIAESSGRAIAIVSVLGVAGVLLLADWGLGHSGHSARQGVLWPILAATAVHSFLDGWSVRALAPQPFTHVAVAVGLALHKGPEGVALGWIARRSLQSWPKALLAGAGVEIFTVLGAEVEPGWNASGARLFGAWWTAAVLAMIAGGFGFLAVHAVAPHWRDRGAMVLFVATLALVGALTFLHPVGI
jgi:zinc transporter ZupT